MIIKITPGHGIPDSGFPSDFENILSITSVYVNLFSVVNLHKTRVQL